MATAAINRRLVERLQALGADALGLSGVDGRLVEARRKEAIRVVENGRQRMIRDDWTGTPTGANVHLLQSLLDDGYLPVDEHGRRRPDALPDLTGPAIVCLQAGNINTGAFDPFVEVCARAHDAGAWVHVDGAFGLWAAAAPSRGHPPVLP